MPVEYRPAPSVERLAGKIIARWHDHLLGEEIVFVFRSEPAKSKGRIVMGRAIKKTGLDAYLASVRDERPMDQDIDDFYVIEIAEPIWEMLEPHQREALVDHELSHISFELVEVPADDGGEPYEDAAVKMIGHDLEEFRAVVERHGLWQPDLEAFAEALDKGIKSKVDEAIDELRDSGITIDGVTGDGPMSDAMRDLAERVNQPAAGHDTTTFTTENLAELRDAADSIFDDQGLGGEAA